MQSVIYAEDIPRFEPFYWKNRKKKFYEEVPFFANCGSPVDATTLSIMTLGVRDLFVALSINNTEHKITHHNNNLV
jgi:hypothetical protein